MNHNFISEEKGTYLLVLKLPKPININVGSLGTISFGKGIYLYIGSALGAGGLRARILRHLRRDKRLFWHIDYLLKYARVIAIYTIRSPQKLECKIAQQFMARNIPYVPRFGSSDCQCRSHLFRIGELDIIDKILSDLNLQFSKIILGEDA